MSGIGDACNRTGKSNVGGSKGPIDKQYTDAKLGDSQSYQIEINRMAPIQKLESRSVPLSQKPVIFSPAFRTKDSNGTQSYDYTNLMNNFEGNKTVLDEDGNIVQNLDIKGKALSASQTTMAFTLNDNDKSTLTLSEKSQDWGKNFEFIDGDNNGKVDEKEYFAMLDNYSKDANSKIGTERVLNETVSLDENAIKDQKALFASMAGEDGILSKDEYVRFNERLMGLGTKDENGNTTVTGKQFKDYVNSIVGNMNIAASASPSVKDLSSNSKIVNEVNVPQIPSKNEFLSKYNLDIDPNNVYSFNSTDKGIELTLIDGTEIKNNWKDGYKPNINGTSTTPPKVYFDENKALVIEGMRGYRGNSTDKTAGNKTLRVFPGDSQNIMFKNCTNIAYQSLGEKMDNITLDNTKGSMFIVGGGNDMIAADTKSGRNDIRRSEAGTLTVAEPQVEIGKEGSNHIAVDAKIGKNGLMYSVADKENQNQYSELFRKSTLKDL